MTQPKYANDNHTRLALLENTIVHIGETLKRHDKRFDTIENRIETRFNEVDQRFIRLENKIDSQFRWIIGTVILGFILPIVSKLLHLG